MKRISNEDLVNKYENELKYLHSTNPRVDFDKHVAKADKYREEILKRMGNKND